MSCEVCKKRNGKLTSLSGRQTELCEECAADIALDSRYLVHLGEVARLRRKKEFAAALEQLTLAEHELLQHDRGGRIAKQLLSDRAQVLQESGDLIGALALLRRRLPLGFDDPSDEAIALLGVAQVLAMLGKITDAEQAANECLDVLERAKPMSALPVLLALLEHVGPRPLSVRGSLVAAALRVRGLRAPGTPETQPVAALQWAKSQKT